MNISDWKGYIGVRSITTAVKLNGVVGNPTVGNIFFIHNASTAEITINADTGTSFYLDSDSVAKTSFKLAVRGMASCLLISAGTLFISGKGVS